MIRLVELATGEGRRKLVGALAAIAACVVSGLGASALLLVAPQGAHEHIVTLCFWTQGGVAASLAALVGGNALEHRARGRAPGAPGAPITRSPTPPPGQE